MVAFLLLVLLARLRTAFVEVLDTDETIFHTVAARMLRGDRLYADVYDLKPPGIFGFYWLVQRLFGPGLFAVHHVTTLIVLATGAALGGIARAATGELRSGLFAAALYFAFHGVGDASTGASSSTEQLAALPTALGVLVLLPRATPARGLAAGLLFGAAILFKPQSGAALLAAAVAIGARGERKLLSLSALAVGAVALPAGTWAAFEAQGLGDAMVRWSLVEGLSYAAQAAGRGWREIPNLLAYLALQLLPVALAVAALRRVLTGYSRLLLGVWLVLALLATAAGGRFYWNYFLLLSAPLAALAGVAAPAVWDRLRPRLRAAAVILALSPSLASQAWLIRQEALGRGSLRAGHRELAREAQRRAQGGEILALGSAAPIYYASGTTGPTPFLISDYLFGFVHPTLFDDPDEIQRHADPARLAELFTAFGRAELRVVVDAPFSAWRGYPMERIPEIGAALRASFAPAYHGRRGSVWVRRPASSSFAQP
jgi:hypothetical protein